MYIQGVCVNSRNNFCGDIEKDFCGDILFRIHLRLHAYTIGVTISRRRKDTLVGPLPLLCTIQTPPRNWDPFGNMSTFTETDLPDMSNS